MLWAAVRRLGAFLATIAGAVALIQVLIALAPGDAIDLLPNADVLRETLAAEWGLDAPLPVRVVRALGRTATLDLGESIAYRPGAPVTKLLASAAGASMAILLPAWAGSIGLALALAWSRRRSHLARLLSALPAFLAAWLLVTGINAAVWAAIGRGWIDRPAFFALPDQESGVRTALAILVLAVASGNLAALVAACETELERLRAAPFLEAARARGAVVWPHLAWNLLPPLLDLGAGRAAALLGTVVVTEKLLLINGAGAMLWQACRQRDYPLAIGITLVAALFVAFVRLIADLARIALDPRLSRSGS